MNIQLGIYEIFSTIIPGCVYLVWIFELLILTGGISVKWQDLNGVTWVSALFLLVVAYLLGVIFGRFGLFLYKQFKKEDISVESLKQFKQKHEARWDMDFVDDDWHILLAFVRSKSLDLAREIERHQASAIMLRNISFGFLLLAIINMGQYIWLRNIYLLIVGIVLLIFSRLMISDSMKFRHWYYDSILSSILAYRIDLGKSIKPVEPPAKEVEIEAKHKDNK
jgi:hypothetical protein